MEKWIYPVKNKRITSPYGKRTLNGQLVDHEGVDFTGHNATAQAACDGTVIEVLKPDRDYPCRFAFNSATGKFDPVKVPAGRAWTPRLIIECDYDPRIKLVYMHGAPIDAKMSAGVKVKAGQDVIKIGNFGYSQGAHLHFEIRVEGAHTDPIKFLDERIA